VQVISILIDHEISPLAIRNVTLLRHVQTYIRSLREGTSTGKLFDSMPRNDALVELWIQSGSLTWSGG
jgi:hypothetical protein